MCSFPSIPRRREMGLGDLSESWAGEVKEAHVAARKEFLPF